MIKIPNSLRMLSAILVIDAAACGLSVHAQSPSDSDHAQGASSSGGVVQKVEKTTDKAVHATERTTRKVVHATKRTTRHAVHATERTGGKVGNAVSRTASRAAGSLRHTGEKIGKKLPKGEPAPHDDRISQ